MFRDIFATIAWSVTMSWLFLLWSILQNITDTVMTNSGWNKLMSEFYCDDQMRASNSDIVLGDIVCNQLLVSHFVTTFSVGDHPDIHARYAVRASGSMKQNELAFSLCLTRQTIKPERAWWLKQWHLAALFLLLLLLLAQQPLSEGLPVPLNLWAWLSVTYWSPHSRIVSPTYGGTVHLGLKPMTSMMLSRTSWRLYYETGPAALFIAKKKT